MNKFAKSVCALALAATALGAAPARAQNADVVGTFLGTIFGGVIGSQIGGAGATIVGAAAGGLIGQQIGKDVQEADRRAAREAYYRSFERPVGERIEWSGSHYGSTSGAGGRVWTTREYTHEGMVCRETVSEVWFNNGRSERVTSTFCRDRYGNWRQWEERTTGRPSPMPAPPPPEYRSGALACAYNGWNFQPYRANNRSPIGVPGNGFQTMRDCGLAIEASNNGSVCSWDGGQFVAYDIYSNRPRYAFGGDFYACTDYTRGGYPIIR